MRLTILQYKNASYVYLDGIETAAHRWQWALLKAVLKRFKKILKSNKHRFVPLKKEI